MPTKTTVTRDDVEEMLHRWTEWKANQRGVDAVMGVVDLYAATLATGEAGVKDAADSILAQARHEAQQIVQSARDEVSATRQDDGSPSLQELSQLPPSLSAYQADDGAVWLRVGPPMGPVPDAAEMSRQCTTCRTVRVIARFSRDAKGRGGYKAVCKDCENVQRRGRRLRSAASKQEVTQGVQP